MTTVTAKDLIAWIETSVPVTQGERAGEMFSLMPWERRFVRGLMRPEVQIAALSVARGNGKTGLLSAIAAAYLAGPLRVPRGEIVIVASSHQQARIPFKDVLAIVEPEIEATGGRDTGRRPRDWRVSDALNQSSILHRPTGASMRVIGSDPRRAHGQRPVLALLDEPAQWPDGTSERMYSALSTALGKIPNAKIVALGTRPVGTEHWFARLLDGGADFALCYAAAADDPPYRMRTWKKANPSIDYMPELKRAIAADAKRARNDPALGDQFRALRLNGGTADTQRPLLISADAWRACERPDHELPPASGPYVLGVDLGYSHAMSAAAAYWPETYRLEVLAAFPHTPDLETRGRRDHVANLYVRMHERGELLLAGERVVDVSELLIAAVDRWGIPSTVLADRWREAELLTALDAAALPSPDVVVRGQGWKDGGEDVRLFRRAVAARQVVAPRLLLLRSAFSGAVVLTDAAGNAKLARRSEAGRRAKHRDDAAAAAILAVAEGMRQLANPQAPAWSYSGGVI